MQEYNSAPCQYEITSQKYKVTLLECNFTLKEYKNFSLEYYFRLVNSISETFAYSGEVAP